MILLFAVPIVVAVVVFISLYRDGDLTWPGMIFAALGIGFVSALICIVPVCILSECVLEESLVYQQEPAQTLYAFTNTSALEGRFYLASGTIKEKPCYYYIVQEDKGMKLISVSADQVYIEETNEEPSITKYAGVAFKNKILWIFAIPERDYYIIRIPAGSVAQSYQVKLN